MRYTIHSVPPAGLAEIDFSRAETGRLDNVRPESAPPFPDVRFRVLRAGADLYVRFDLRDRNVRSVQTECQSPVCTDSCVECFLRPGPGPGYFNLEVNAGGTLLLSYVEDPARTPDGGLAKCTLLPEAACRRVETLSSLPRVVEPELAGPVDWTLRARIPTDIFEPFTGPVSFAAPWRGNFYKCGDKTSRPHWLSWSPVSALNFHLPECFGDLLFDD